MDYQSFPIPTATGNPRKHCHPSRAPLGSVLRQCRCDQYRDRDPATSQYPCPHCGHACCWEASIDPR